MPVMRNHIIFVTAAILLFLGSAISGHGQAGPTSSQLIGCKYSILDEFGRPLVGTDLAADYFGLAREVGDVVQILVATDGIIYPPDVNGLPDTNNVVLMETRIGLGTLPCLESQGKFSVALKPRPGAGTLIFARVFNAGYVPDASFYGDSQLYTVSGTSNDVFEADIESADQPLDPVDLDGDGLNNSFEKSSISDPSVVDTDGDGANDYEEAVAGTLSTESDSILSVTGLTHVPGGVRVTWSSVPGIEYYVEYSTDLCPDDSNTYSEAGTAVACSDKCEVILDDDQANHATFVRVSVRRNL